MKNELRSIATLINGTNQVKDVDGIARILVYNSDGLVAFDSSKNDTTNNTYLNYTTLSGQGNVISTKNYSERKPTQELNRDQCINNVFQVKPALTSFGLVNDFGKKIFVTEGSETTRVNCNGVSVTGYIRLTIEVPIDKFPFNVCETDVCSKKILKICKLDNM